MRKIKKRLGFVFFVGYLLCSGILSCSVVKAGEFEHLPDVEELTANMPKDVKTFISKTVECNHWGGEEPYDKERSEFIKKAVEKAQCTTLKGSEKQLRAKYKRNPTVLRAMDKAKDISI